MAQDKGTGYVRVVYTHPPTVVGIGYQKVINGEVVDVLDENGVSIKDNPPSTECHVDGNKFNPFVDHPVKGNLGVELAAAEFAALEAAVLAEPAGAPTDVSMSPTPTQEEIDAANAQAGKAISGE